MANETVKSDTVVQDMQLLLRNLYIYYNYDKVIPQYNSCSNYIRTPKSLYWDRIVHLLAVIFTDKEEEEILQTLSKVCSEP